MLKIIVALIILLLSLTTVAAAAVPADSTETNDLWATLVDSDGQPLYQWMVMPDEWDEGEPVPTPEISGLNTTSNPESLVTYYVATGTVTSTALDDLPDEEDTPSFTAYQGVVPKYASGDISLESVIGTDERVRVTPTTEYPWSSICKLYITPAGGSSTYIGSGFLIGSPDGHGYYVLTAAHCLYLHNYGGFASQIRVVPAKDGTLMPFSSAYATDLTVTNEWIDSKDWNYDWGLITLDRSIGDITGWMGLTTADPDDGIYTGTLHTAGYPGDLNSGTMMYYTSNTGAYATDTKHWYYLDTYGGQSGSAVWIYDSETGDPLVVTVHAYGNSGGTTPNSGTRLSHDNLDILTAWQASSVPPVDKPDLVDDGQAFSNFSPSSVVAGVTSFDVNCQVRNIGTAESGNCSLSFYASTDDTVTSSDYLIATVGVPSIPRFDATVVSWNGTFPGTIPEETYYIGWLIDDGAEITELNEGNNDATASGQIETQQNSAPYTPSNPSPPDGATDQDLEVTLEWSGGDPDDGDTVVYDIYFGTVSSPPMVVSGQSALSYDPGTLQLNTRYYWKIVSRDGSSEESESPIWNFSTIASQPATVQADFEGTPIRGTAPLEVQFTDLSLNSPTAWNWSFGDGSWFNTTLSSEKNSTHTYVSEGNYTVSLTASNEGSIDTEMKTEYITVFEEPDIAVEIPLLPGWNMVSLPVDNFTLNIPSEVVSSVYEYRPATQSYALINIQSMQPGRGYWVAATGECNLTATGDPPNQYGIDLSQGWNMIGSLNFSASFSNPQTDPEGSVLSFAYWYNPSTQSYLTVYSLEPGKGYWVAATADCTLTVE